MANDSGVKYVEKEHVTHLVGALQQYYKIDIDWEGHLYYGLTLDWDYNKPTMDISMPGYIQRTFFKFQHPIPKNTEYAPFKGDPKKYGAKV